MRSYRDSENRALASSISWRIAGLISIAATYGSQL